MKGIIFCGGGHYLLCALVNIRLLRMHGCKLPIELWHFKNESISGFSRSDLSSWNVTLRVLPALPTGYASKPYAISHSEFEEILCIDADNTPIRNPEYLFDCEEYVRTGALFWPDFLKAPPDEAWSELARRSPVATWQQESGQLLINRRVHRKALNHTLELNYNYDKIKGFLWGCGGDKDTFQLSWYANRSDFHMIRTFPGSCGLMNGNQYVSNSMVQHDPQGNPLFLHKNAKKWHIVRKVENCWERMLFPKNPTGEDIKVIVHGNTNPHTHEFLPPENVRTVDAKSIIGDLEDRCLELIGQIRSRLWYKATVYSFLVRFHARKRLKRQ